VRLFRGCVLRSGLGDGVKVYDAEARLLTDLRLVDYQCRETKGHRSRSGSAVK